MQKSAQETRVTRTDRLKVKSHEKHLKGLGTLKLENKKDIITTSGHMRGYYKESGLDLLSLKLQHLVKMERRV